MYKIILIAVFLLVSKILTAQEWTDPVNISNMTGTDYYPDITVSADGNLHCVWMHKYSNQHIEIYYSKSFDEGMSWSIPISISKNDTLAVSTPHIVADSQNNLYVTYEYNSYSSPFVVMQKFDGNNWSNRDTVVNGYSYSNVICIDSENRLYVFWYQHDDKFHYKYLENGIWSDEIIPYNTGDFNVVYEAVSDKNNNIHVIGNYIDYISYFKYNKLADQWDTPVILSENTHLNAGSDIALDNNKVYTVWHESWSEIASFEHATFYSFNDGSNWSAPELIAENAYGQRITSYNNKVYIMDAESELNDKMSLVLHQQDTYGNWYGNKFFICDGLNGLEMLRHGSKLFVIFYWYFNGVDLDISIMQTKYGVGIDEIENISSILILNQNYPNPVNNNTEIKYTLKESGYCTLNIYNIEGKLVNTIVNKKQKSGSYTIEWNCRNTKGNKLPAGIYYYRLSLDHYTITKSLILTRN